MPLPQSAAQARGSAHDLGGLPEACGTGWPRSSPSSTDPSRRGGRASTRAQRRRVPAAQLPGRKYVQHNGGLVVRLVARGTDHAWRTLSAERYATLRTAVIQVD
jgi:hypothetical protein